ncbi:hypothetical protein Dimus_011502 [Dionaea muscipula]
MAAAAMGRSLATSACSPPSAMVVASVCSPRWKPWQEKSGRGAANDSDKIRRRIHQIEQEMEHDFRNRENLNPSGDRMAVQREAWTDEQAVFL